MDRSLSLNNQDTKKKDEDIEQEIQMNKLVDDVIQNCKLTSLNEPKLSTSKVQTDSMNMKLLLKPLPHLRTAPASPKRKALDTVFRASLKSINETYSSDEYNYSEKISILEPKPVG